MTSWVTKAGTTVGGLAMAAGLVVVGAAPVGALADACELRQITAQHLPGQPDTAPGFGGARVTADGGHLLFSTTYDLTGDNPDGSAEIFEHAIDTDTTEQLTDLSGVTVLANLEVSDDGSVLAFLSNRTDAGNTDGSNEIFVWDRDIDQVEAITDGWVGTFLSLEMDAVGDRVAFNDGRTDAQNPDGGQELWLHDRSDATTTALTSAGSTGINELALSGDGTTVVYADRRDPLGTNPDGSFEVFVQRPDTAEMVQATAVPGSPSVNEVAIDHAGDVVAVTSQADLDGIADGGTFHHTVLDPWTGEATQLSAISGSESFIQRPGLSASGTRASSFSEVLEDGRWLATSIRDVTTGELAVGMEREGIVSVTLSPAGDRMAIVSKGNPTGANPDRSSELFLATCPTFRDVVPSHPFAEHVEWFASQGITNGYPDGTFRPLTGVSRQAAWAFIYRLAGSPAHPPPAAATFTDVPLTHTFSTEIEWAVHEGITRGYDDGTFRPLEPVTRQAFAAFLYRSAGEPAFVAPSTATFHDVSPQHPFSLEVEWSASLGLTEGYADGTYRPAATVSRQAAAALLHRLVDGPGIDV